MAEEVAPEIAVQAAAEADAAPAPTEAEEPAAEPAAAEAAPEQPVADTEQPAADGGVKRGREDEQGLDGEEPEAKRAAAEPNAEAAPPEVPAQDEQGQQETAAAGVEAVQNGSDNPGHNNPGPEVAHGYEAYFAAAAAGAGTAAASVGGNPTGPQPVQEHPELTTHNEDGSISEVLAVSKHLVGKLIGKGGTTIQQLQATTATNVQIDQDGRDFADAKKVTVRGSTENVARAKAAIRQMLEEAIAPQEGEIEERVPCPAGIVGRIIGRGGETIRSLQQGSGAHILVDQNFPEGADRMVVIKGKPDSVHRAMNMVTELIKGEPGSATQIIQKYGLGVALSLSCPKAIVGRIIGKGGETIKGLQRKYHVSIQIDQGGDPMNVTITGPKVSAEACRGEVNVLISEPPPFGDFGGPGGFPRPGGYGPPFGGPAAFSGPPGGYGGYPPYQAPYGGYPPAAGGYGGYPPAAGGYGSYYGQQQQQQQPAAAASGGYGGYPASTGGYGAGGAGGAAGGYGQQAGAYGAAGGAAAGGGGYGTDAGGYAAGGAAAGGGAAVAAPAAAPAGSLWQAMQDEQGRTYYYNTQTGVSQWEKPDGMP